MAPYTPPAAYSAPVAYLLTLCENGEHEQLLSSLQDDATLLTVLSREAIEIWPDTTFARTEQFFIFERMLVAAARSGHAEVISALLNFGQQRGVAVPYMVTTDVVYAALHQETDTLELLLALQRSNPEVFSTRLPLGRHILETVCLGSKRDPQARLSVLHHMMEMGFDPNLHLPHHGQKRGVLLYKASKYACVEMVECLLQHGATITGSKALRGAARFSRVDVLEILLRYGADLNECFAADIMVDGPAGAALHVAVANGQVEAVRWLIENGADSRLENCDGITPGDLLSGNNNEISRLLGITS